MRNRWEELRRLGREIESGDFSAEGCGCLIGDVARLFEVHRGDQEEAVHSLLSALAVLLSNLQVDVRKHDHLEIF